MPVEVPVPRRPHPQGEMRRAIFLYLPTFLVQFSQFFLVFNSQLGHFLQLTIIPRTIMSGTKCPNQADEENMQKRGRKRKKRKNQTLFSFSQTLG